MSASTVSITANNAAAARRRPVVAGEKRTATTTTSIELVGLDEMNAAKDLSQSIRGGETVLERSSDPNKEIRKTLNSNSSVPTRRTRKVVPPKQAEKPKWVTVLSVFVKNFLLIVSVLVLVHLVRKLTAMRGGEEKIVIGSEVALREFEGRFVEMEKFVKTTTKMMQVQVEVVDKKIEDRVEGAKRELDKKREENAAVVEKGLRELLESRTARMENELHDKMNNFISRKEFDTFVEELKKDGSGEGEKSGLSLDDVRAYAREVIEKEIEKHSADGLGRVDYALASSGAVVIRHSEVYVVGKGSSWLHKSWGKNGVHVDAEKMLKPSFGEPGQCFPLKGSNGFVQIRLRTAIVPEAVTLEHVAKSVAYDRSSAPKDCRISGWLQGGDVDLTDNPDKMFLLTEFTYDLDKSSAQTFSVSDSAAAGLIDTVRFDFASNHGSPSHTCIYRLRVHGHEPDSVSMLLMQS